MKKRFLFAVLLIAGHFFFLKAAGNELILSEPLTGSQAYESCRIVLKPGFRFSSKNQQTLRLSIASGCTPSEVTEGENSMITITPNAKTSFVEFENGVLSVGKSLDPNATAAVSIQYFDGLGRPTQANHYGLTPNGYDLIQLQEYDAYGNASTSWNAIASDAKGEHLTPQQVKLKAKAQYADDNPYSLIQYEPSPLNRPSKQYGSGQDWHGSGKAVTTEYFTNAASGELAATHYSVNANGSLQCHGPYAEGSLHVTKTTNEDGFWVLVFKDKLGRTILTRGGYYANDTYHVYNNLNQLTYVLPPEASRELRSPNTTYTLTNDYCALNRYAYIYEYDHRNRCVSKKLPGVKPVDYQYNELDQLVWSKDGSNNVITHTYDELNRLNVTTANGVGVQQNFYDDHFFFPPRLRAYLGYIDKPGFDKQHEVCRGLLTGTSISNLLTTLYYDAKGRVVQGHMQNHLGGYDHHYYAYSFTGEVLRHRHEHSILDQPAQVQEYTYGYDHAGRLLSMQHALNGAAPETLATYTYDELGRLRQKMVGNEFAATDHHYNVRGWLTAAQGTHFSQQLYYQNLPQGINATSSYSGNMSAMTWQVQNDVQRGYAYNYDHQGRLTYARYGEGDALEQNAGRYNEYVEYDANGNPSYISRYGVKERIAEQNIYGEIDNYNIYRDGNLLHAIGEEEDNILTYSGAANFYGGGSCRFRYDNNGNLTYHEGKGITSMTYNYLNLPQEVNFKVGHKYQYTYSAAGEKQRVVTVTNRNAHLIPVSTTDYADLSSALYYNDTTDYCGSFIYRNGRLSMLLTEGGFISFPSEEAEAPAYHYYLTDHLGSNRVVLNQSGAVEQVNHYYPFGMEFNEQNFANLQPYKFGGKEEQHLHLLGLIDFHARQYDPALVTFTSPDPHAESYYGWSPYVYCANNPMRITDPDGKDWYEDQDGNTMWRPTSEETYTDNNDRVWTNIGTEYLLFDGYSLYYFTQVENENGEQQLDINSYGAVSGRVDGELYSLYTEERQAEKEVGPIPERIGVYSINPQKIQKYQTLSSKQKTYSRFGRGSWPGGTKAWGEYRVWIEPSRVNVLNPKTKEYVIRDNLSIHGGDSPGSAGCIDLHKNANAFFYKLSKSKSSFIRLNVMYSGLPK